MNNNSKSINYLGSKGFFTDYNSNKNMDISQSVAEQWAKGFVKLLDKDFSFKNLESYLKKPWFKEAAAPKVYRFYEGADKYIKLEGAKF